MASGCRGYRQAAALGVAALTVWLGLLVPLHAQAPSSDGVYYTKQSAFVIPFQTEAGERRIQQVVLYVSEDQGRTYQVVSTANPQDRSFRFQARRDGWYWFTVQTVDADNRSYPPNVAQAQPGLKVCVDTAPPMVIVRPLALRDWAAGVEWDLRDENLDLVSLRVDYRVANGREWVPLPVQQLAQGQHGWNPSVAAPLEVRVQIRDKAGNNGEATTLLTPGALRPGDAGGAGGEPFRGSVLMVNKRRIQLNYRIDDIGPSDVTAIEIWITSDGRTWQRYDQVAPKNPPYVVEVAREGRYGFTLIAKSGVGNSEPPPRPGDSPQVWVEVDETKPQVRLQAVEVGRGVEAGTLTVRWSASDRFLAAAPIKLSYAANKEGPWTPIANELPNDGRYTWRMGDGVPYKFLVRVEAVDQAGNVGLDETAKEVVVDLAVPKARLINVEAAPGQGMPPARDPQGMSPARDPLPSSDFPRN